MRTTQRTSASYREPQADIYRLKFGDDRYGIAKEIEFEAYDAYKALVIAHGEAQVARPNCGGRAGSSARSSGRTAAHGVRPWGEVYAASSRCR
jgi:hypothetical protein